MAYTNSADFTDASGVAGAYYRSPYVLFTSTEISELPKLSIGSASYRVLIKTLVNSAEFSDSAPGSISYYKTLIKTLDNSASVTENLYAGSASYKILIKIFNNTTSLDESTTSTLSYYKILLKTIYASKPIAEASANSIGYFKFLLKTFYDACILSDDIPNVRLYYRTLLKTLDSSMSFLDNTENSRFNYSVPLKNFDTSYDSLESYHNGTFYYHNNKSFLSGLASVETFSLSTYSFKQNKYTLNAEEISVLLGYDPIAVLYAVLHPGRPEVSFSAMPLYGPIPFTVAFQDSSSGPPDSWLWNFGDGQTSTLQNPTHIYTSVGTWTVTLTVTNSYGTSSLVKKDYIISAPETTQWTKVADQLYGQSIVYSQGVYKNELYAGTYPDAMLFKWNGTNAWTRVADTPRGQRRIMFLKVYNGRLFGSSGDSGMLFRWNDVDAWETVAEQFLGQAYILTLIIFEGRLYGGTGTNGYLFRWNDVDAWELAAEQLNGESRIYSLNEYKGELYAGTGDVTGTNYGGRLLKWDRNGHWIQVADKLNSQQLIASLVVSNNKLYGLACQYEIYDLPFGGRLYEWNENDAWIQVADTFDGETQFGANLSVGGGVYAGTSPGGKLFRFNGVNSWVKITDSYSGQYAATLGTYNGYMFLGSRPNGYLLRSNIPELIVRADFYGTPLAGGFPLTVTFTDTSYGSPVSWLWDFGDGATSTDQNPIHTFEDPGTYTVTLTASNTQTTDTLIRSNYIRVASDLFANFSASVSTGNVPLAVSFTDLSAGNPTSWRWDFGDGATSQERNPTHTYSVAGIYDVTLTIYKGRYSDSYTISDCVTAEPLASFTWDPEFGDANLSVRFTDTTLGSPTNWLWDLGDGTTSTLQNPVHVYTKAGTFDVTLTAYRGSLSNTVTYSQIISVNIVPEFTADITAGDYPLTVNFTDESLGEPTSWAWNFGDGATSPAKNPTHIYTVPDIYDVTLTITRGASDATIVKTAYIKVYEHPTADFSGAPRTGRVPLSVSFDDLSIGEPTSWAWSFGDGSTSSIQNPAHVYLVPGSYAVALLVERDGLDSTKTVPNYITAQKAVEANFSQTQTDGELPLAVQFTDTSLGSPTSWLWNFGDGSTATEQNPLHVYEKVGTFTVTLTVYKTTYSDSITKTNLVTTSFYADFTADTFSGDPPLTVNFTDLSVGHPTVWKWDFGDFTTSSLQNPRHTFYHPGVYTIRLFAYRGENFSLATKARYITVGYADVGPATHDLAVPDSRMDVRTAYGKGHGNYVFIKKGIRIEKPRG